MSSSQVPLWVTLLIAFIGLLGVLSAQFIAAWREDRRWRREQEREELRWRRERQRELDNRDFEGRQTAYAQVVGAIEGFDWLIYPAMSAIRNGREITPEIEADLRRAREEIRLSLGPINLHAPKRFNELLRAAVLPRSRIAMDVAGGINRDRDHIESLWNRGQDAYRQMRAHMRRDLGLDAEDLPGTE
ncbi:hypothetical protein [Actinocrispum sp. NPDC049592]|uniref:hypothetical protein n=1 Tax=Actinocrispum sp. NPDC049592 TaxID=3154835 RepID=UPI00343F2782